VTPRVREEWARRVAAEYRSAGITAQVLAWAIQAGLPPELLHLATRIVTDELDHARLSHEVLAAMGGEAEPVPLAAADLEVAGPLPHALVRAFCLGETFAVPYFAAMLRGTTHPGARAVVERILRDEATHRAFGWEALDAVLALDPAVVAPLRDAMPALVHDLRGYADPPPAPPVTPKERACGLLDHAEYAAIYAMTWAEDVRPRLVARGLWGDDGRCA